MQEDVITSGPGNETGERQSLHQWPCPMIQASKQIADAHNDKNSSGGENVYVVFPIGLLLKCEYWHNVGQNVGQLRFGIFSTVSSGFWCLKELFVLALNGLFGLE